MTSLDDVLSQERTYHDLCRAALTRMTEGAGEPSNRPRSPARRTGACTGSTSY
ncbi:hypothetical protein [Streptomyces sp. NPDC055287]